MNSIAIDTRFRMPTTGNAFSPWKVTGGPSGKYPLVTEAQFLAFLGLSPTVVGTGSNLANALTNVSLRRASGSRSSSIVAGDRLDYIEPGKLTSEIVNTIRTSFGLSVTDLASILGVERPTIYSWLKDQSTPAAARMQRMGAVLRLADIWTSKTGGTAAPVLTALTKSGITLLEALKEPKLWESEILAAMDAQVSNFAAPSRRSRLSVLARERRLELSPASEFDLVTGRPLGPER